MITAGVVALGVGAVGAGDIAVIGAILTAIITAVTLAVKAGPAWNTSLINNARGEAERLSKDLAVCRTEARRASTRAERYRLQLIRAGVAPYDEETTDD